MYDVAVLGSGPGGYVAALRAALRGAKVCCIEQGQIGGTCLNVGCIPTKTMLHASETFWHIRQAAEFGISVENPKIDEKVYMNRTAKVVSSLRNGVGFLLKKRKVDVINGRGTIVAADTIDVKTPKGTQQVKAKAIIIATGAQPVRPGFLPWDCPHLMTTDEATTAKELPKSVLVLGGGVIGCEFATVYSELGIPTTIVEMLDNLVDNLDSDISKAVTDSLKKRDVNIITGTKLVSVKPTKTGIVAELEDGQKIEAAKMLVSIGRQPNTKDIGLEKLGVKMDNGLVVVDDNCRSSVAGIYAIGDIAETRQYAHLASRMGIVAADHASGYHTAGDDRSVVPTGIYTHPEAATVGLSEAQAKQSNPNIRVSRFPYSASGMAQAYGQTEGLVKLIADAEIGNILGAVVIGLHATDIIQEIAVAMRAELTIEDIAETIHPHPTFTEAVGEAAEAWLGMPIHTI